MECTVYIFGRKIKKKRLGYILQNQTGESRAVFMDYISSEDKCVLLMLCISACVISTLQSRAMSTTANTSLYHLQCEVHRQRNSGFL